MPLVSVIMPVKNGERYVASAIRSVMNQTLADLELLVVENGSSDATVEIVRDLAASDRRIRLLALGDVGLVAALNRGLAEAEADYVARMDADDVAESTRLETQARYLDEHDECLVVGSAYTYVDADGTLIGRRRVLTSDRSIRAELFFGNPIGHPTVMFAHRRAPATIEYSDAYPDAEDFELWLRLSAEGELANISAPLLDHRVHPSAATQVTGNRNRDSAIRALVDHAGWPDSKPIFQATYNPAGVVGYSGLVRGVVALNLMNFRRPRVDRRELLRRSIVAVLRPARATVRRRVRPLLTSPRSDRGLNGPVNALGVGRQQPSYRGADTAVRGREAAHRSAARLVRSTVRVVSASLRVISRRLSSLMPKDRDTWVFGSRGDLYTDNPMYLFEFVREHHPDVAAAWITGDAELARSLRRSGRVAHTRTSLQGIWALLRAKVNVYASDPADTSFAFTGGAINVNPYHGLPIKQIEFDIGTEHARRIYHPVTLSERVRSRSLYAPKWEFQDILATSSRWAEDQFRRSYEGRVGTVVQGCSPRMGAVLNGEPVPPELFPAEHELASLMSRHGGPTLLYAPTWRRYEWDPSETLGDIGALQNALEASDAILLVKWHMFSDVSFEADRVVAVSNAADISAILAHVDGLITDYSSVGLDAALIGTPVIWTPIDRERYQEQESPDFDLDYDALTSGRCVRSTTELHTVLATGEWVNWTIPDPMVDLIWGTDAKTRVATSNQRLAQAALNAARSLD